LDDLDARAARYEAMAPPARAALVAEMRAEIGRLRAENARLAPLDTLVACVRCDRGVRARDAVAGMCPACAGAELERLRADSLRFYHAAGTSEVLGSPEEVVARRKAAAADWEQLDAGRG